MESYWWGLFVAGLFFFFGGLIEMLKWRFPKKPYGWVFTVIVGLVLTVWAVVLIFQN